ncbi:ribosome assembly factor SBDS [Candidatus Pacearchaeota archaeon]|nr:ribosome assembly factor SBDS [Candidatus Pacearchaeota archaeon]
MGAKVLARYKVKSTMYEIQVDLDEALKVQAGKGNIQAALDMPKIYSDLKKGQVASQDQLTNAFNTTDVYAIATTIIQKGEVQKNQDFRDAEREAKVKQVIQLILKNAVDQHGRPYTEERIKRALEEAKAHIDNKPAEQQLTGILDKLKLVIPIKLDTKRIKLTIPAQYSGQVYGLIKDFKESEDWLANGSLQAVLNIPAGMQLDFYDKLNGITHGAVQSEEVKE